MQILNVLNVFFPEYTGTSIRSYNLLSRISSDSIIITRDKTKNGEIIPLKQERFNNISVERISLDPDRFWSKAPFRYFYLTNLMGRKIIKSSMDKEFDIVHGHDIALLGQYARKISILSNKPFVLEFHSFENLHYGFMAKMYDQIFKTSQITQYCDSIIVLTDSFKEYVVNSFNVKKNDVTVVPNGVDIDKFLPREIYEKKITDLKKNMGLSGKVILYAGYMDKINGIVDLASIIPSIIKESHDVSFLFIGHGPEKYRIDSLCELFPQVKYLPMVKYDDMPLFYQMCDIFIIPRPSTVSAELISPLKLLEAMSMEKTVLCSNVGGIAEIIKDRKNGYLFQKDNLKDLKCKLIDIIDVNTDKTSKNARKTIEKGYTWDKSADILQSTYDNLI